MAGKVNSRFKQQHNSNERIFVPFRSPSLAITIIASVAAELAMQITQHI